MSVNTGGTFMNLNNEAPKVDKTVTICCAILGLEEE